MSDGDPHRRQVLKSVGATIAGGLSITGTASARSSADAVVHEQGYPWNRAKHSAAVRKGWPINPDFAFRHTVRWYYNEREQEIEFDRSTHGHVTSSEYTFEGVEESREINDDLFVINKVATFEDDSGLEYEAHVVLRGDWRGQGTTVRDEIKFDGLW